MAVEKSGRREFILGMLAGALATLCALAVGAAVLLQRGVRVDVELEPLAALVREQVTVEARRGLPELVSELESRVPELVAAEMAGRMQSAATINVADFTLELPDSVTKLIQDRLQEIVTEVVYECFTEFDSDWAADRLGEQAYELVKTSLASEVSETFVQYRLFGRVPIPVLFNFR